MHTRFEQTEIASVYNVKKNYLKMSQVVFLLFTFHSLCYLPFLCNCLRNLLAMWREIVSRPSSEAAFFWRPDVSQQNDKGCPNLKAPSNVVNKFVFVSLGPKG